jgi:transposase
MQCEEDWAVMHALHQSHGWSISRIAREFDVTWRTARRYATAETVPRYRPRARPAELSPAQAAHVTRRLGAHPELRATTLYREVQQLGYAGSYPSFARRVRLLRPVDHQADPQVRFETDPGVQVQADWADCGRWLVGEQLCTLHALVAVLGFSRVVVVRFAVDTTRPTTLRLLTECLVELGGAPGEVLTDRDPALVVGSTPSGRPVFAPEWVDLAEVLGIRPRACRPYRAKTKGKVERVIRELKEDFLAWATGQPMPPQPMLADYDRLAATWCTQVVAARRHRTTGRVVAEAWSTERPLLGQIPDRVLTSRRGGGVQDPAQLIDLRALRNVGDVVEAPSLADYEAVLG